MVNINLDSIAKTAHIDLSLAEKAKFEKQCNEILKMFEQIEEIDVENVAPSFQPIEVKNITREDIVCNKNHKQIILSKDLEDGFFVGPRIK
ncbi:Asp-tRNA(Asn)/Glu-tRNA(Gln) amidotransferase subunit GatC [bacterium]|nr:Asp-tRNA(Asn)/Glu-tRNA(Gln) amidotransferase subunit GatC [archaeon]NCS98433.1 Asp-tRNA(Asn)/Glu-tRNA(Gln) amidotransferase subunit GatC [archaeon]